jgi:hypothetical protein
LIIDLSALSFPVTSGSTIVRLERLGNFTPSGSGTEFSTSMLGVFSSSNTLLASSNQIRIPGAIDAGVDFVTAPTFLGSLATDIAQDFFVDPGGEPSVPPHTFVDVQVPVGAQFLMICSYDSHYSTNADTNGDFAVRVTAVPEVHTLGLLGVGAAALLTTKRKRARIA